MSLKRAMKPRRQSSFKQERNWRKQYWRQSINLSCSESAPLVSYQGSVFEACPLVRERFTEVLKGAISAVTITPPQFEPVVGAVLIACESIGWKLDQTALKNLETKVGNEVPAALKSAGQEQ